MVRLLVFLIFMVCGAGLFYLVFVHKLPTVEEEESGQQPLSSDVSMTTVHLQQHRGSTLEFEADADTATYNENTRQAWLTTVNFHVYRTNDDPPEPTDIHGVANTAFVDDVRKRVLLQGKVHVLKGEDTEVHADVVDYYTDDGVVKAHGNLEVRDKKSHVQGESLVYNINGERIVVNVPKLYQ